VEGDSDKAFYEEINNRLEKFGGNHIRHSIFLNAHGKHTAAEIAKPLRKIGIPTALILDIDWVKEDGTVAKKYLDACGLPSGLHQGKIADRKQVRDYLIDANVNYKRNGGVGILGGGKLDAATEFFDTIDRYGLFTVRVGEVEAWLSRPDVSKNKSTWLFEMFASLGSDPDDEAYERPYDGDVWKFVGRVADWLKDPDHRGML
ncbi:TOPRIM nucleotidyl transferase/hydrolase domain-containing protein, partial [Methylobacterium sp. WL7]|uniref:TOPRIM nucleotidyl transferase/hydrolase domain-containing protein n=1 Tax=Methylobacterium sp. WL7 TaxID=2603900 RepID=UPI001AEEFA02